MTLLLDKPSYSLKRAQSLLGLSRGVIEGLIRSGFVAPERGLRSELQFTFQDLVLLRTARALHLAKISPRRIMRSLTRLKEQLPEEMPLSGLRIVAVGSEVVVLGRGGPWEAESGQMLLDFEVAPVDGGVAFLPSESAEPESPKAWLQRGEALEAEDPDAAELAYRGALGQAPDYIDALLNLGALLCERDRCQEAVQLYEEALKRLPRSAPLHFNHAIALEDLKHLALALSAYERCLDLDPQLADAHFNASRLYEELGDFPSALRHLNAYRRLQRS